VTPLLLRDLDHWIEQVGGGMSRPAALRELAARSLRQNTTTENRV
jgi:hypothetical protein